MNLIEEKAYKHIGIEWPDLPETNIGTGGYEPAEDHSLERKCFVEGAVWQSKQYDTYQGSFRHIPGNYLDCIDERMRNIEYIKNRILTLQLSIFDFETHTQDIQQKEKLEEALKQVEDWKGEIISRLQDYEAFRYDYKQNWNLNYNDYDGKLVYN